MSTALTLLAWALAVIATAPLLVLCVELLAGLWPARWAGSANPDCRVAVLIPAHDEQSGIVVTVTALFAVVPAGTRVLVVADNCSDDTAELARGAGADVVERNDSDARGKGFALACGRDWLASGQGGPPDVVVILDADCRLLPGSLEALADAALRASAPVQAVNLIDANLAEPAMVQVSGFAMLVKNLYRSRGMQRLGGAALLTGTGMAFPWPLFRDAHLATGSIVEDLALGIELTQAGHVPRLIHSAGVRSAPAALDDALAQKSRWEHGFLDTLRSRALPLLARGVARLSPAQALLGLHLMVPPLALLLVAAGGILGVLAGLTLLGADAAPLLTLTGVLLVALVQLFCAWLTGGRDYLSGRALLKLPLYILWKLPVYINFLRKPQVDWNRTPRGP